MDAWDESEALLSEIVALTGEDPETAMRKALDERLRTLKHAAGSTGKQLRLRRFLASEVWPMIPESQSGRRLSREEEAEILGYGPEGV